MQTHPKKLLVIIGESALEKFLVRDIKEFGANGYTITDVRGGGTRGAREAAWEGDRSIRMEIICDESVAKKNRRACAQCLCGELFTVALF